MQKENIIPFAFGTSDYKAANEWWITAAVNAYFSRDELKKYLTAEKPWNSPEMTEAINNLKYLWQQGYINDKKSYSISNDAAWNLFYSNKAAMKMTGTWGTKSLMENDPSFKWGTFLIPAFSEKTQPSIPVGISTGIGINAKTKYPDETAAFINFLHSKEVIQKQLKFGDYYPIKGLDVASVEGVSPKIVETYKVMNKAFENDSAGYVSWTYWPPSVDTHLWQEFDSLVLGDLSLKDYLDKAQKLAEKDDKDGLLILGK
jgi:raffinose/stachyose/melibiose transport system substrate-binding protein